MTAMTASCMNAIEKSRRNDVHLQSAIAQARAGIVPSGICLAVSWTADGAEQVLTREGDDIVCRKNGVITRRTPIDDQLAPRLCAAFLARHNA